MFLTDECYQLLVDEVKNAKTSVKKVPHHYWLLNKYDVMIGQQKAKFIKLIQEGCMFSFMWPIVSCLKYFIKPMYEFATIVVTG